jgi:predicted metal-dependent peptidase
MSEIMSENIKADKKIRQALEIVKQRSLFSYFFLRQFTFTATEQISTLAVVNKEMTIIYNPNLINAVPDEVLAGFLMHELSHSILRHFERRGSRNPLLWNISTDGVINEDLLMKGWKLEVPGMQIIKGEFFRNKSAEQVYSELAKRGKTQEQLQNEYGNTLDQHPKEENNGDGMTEGKEENEKETEGSGDENEKKNKRSRSRDGLGKESEKDADESKDRVDRVDEAIRKAIFESQEYAKKNMQNGRMQSFGLSGKEPNQVIEQIFDISSMRFQKFEDLIKYEIYDALGDEQNWLFPHVISSSVGEYLPSMNDRKKKIIIVVDTSGSIEDWKAEQFVNLVNRIVKRRNDVEGRIIECDDAVLSDEILRNNFKKMTIRRGNGGTSFREAVSYIQRRYRDARVVLYFTDGRGEMPEKRPTFKLLWILNEQDADDYVVDTLNKYGKVLTYKR